MAELQRFALASEENAKLLKLMNNPDMQIEGLSVPQDRKYERIALKILNYFWRLESKTIVIQTVFISMSR